MKEDINNILNVCFDEFQSMLLADYYINLKSFNNFLDKYQDTLELVITKDFDIDDMTIRKSKSILNNGYKIINERNKRFVNRKLDEYKDYFDNMFNNIDEKIKLSDEQKKSILIDEDYSLIMAGAGSGKTTTMSAKIKYLVDKCNVDPNDILLLAYTNEATMELKKRINKNFNIPVDILNFKKLSLNILKKRNNSDIKLVSDDLIKKYISNYITDYLFHNKTKLEQFINCFDEYVNFEKFILECNSFEEYFNKYTEVIYEESKENLEEYIVKRIQNRMNSYKGIDGIKYRSKAEVVIANYLFKNGYDYKYKEAFPFKLDNEKTYIPDFTIETNNSSSYIEYYGLTKLNNDSKYSTPDIKIYNKLVNKMRKLHSEFGTDLIEIYSDYEDNRNYLEMLEEELNKRNFDVVHKSHKEIFNKIMETSKEINYYKFTEFAVRFIKKFKQNNYESDYFDTLIDKEHNTKIKKQLEFMKEIYVYYNLSIHNKNMLDYNDLINYAYKDINTVKDKFNYKYIIIDEYQDISTAKYELVRRISDIYDSKIVAFGDDWQAAYGLANSNEKLFNNFYDIMGYGEVSSITKTYRNSQELIDISKEFINNNLSFNSILTSNKHKKYPVEIDYYYKTKGINKSYILNCIIKNIYLKGNILLLGRYQSDIDNIIDSPYFKKGVHNKIICVEKPDANIEFMTVHRSKGLEYDNVILLNGLSTTKGFPNMMEDDYLVKLISNNGEINFAEERQLFYVALTRTKNKIYILAPYIPKFKRSDFVLELCTMDNVKENMNYVAKYIKYIK